MQRHFRYINDPTIAKEIMDKDITLEEYLGAVKAADVPRKLREGH